MSIKISDKEFKKIIYNVYGNEYMVLDKYINSSTKILVKHSICNTTFKVLPPLFKIGKVSCPYCDNNCKTVSIEIVERKLNEKFNGEYSLIKNYKNLNTKATFRHNNCSCEKGYFIWDIAPHRLLTDTRCPYESHQQGYTINDFEKRMHKFHPKWKLCDDAIYKNSRTLIPVICDKGHKIYVTLDNIKNGCIYCSGQKPRIGETDLWTTHPEIASNLKNKYDGYNYSFYTKTKLHFICPKCGKEHFKLPSIVINDHYEFVCECSDGISYPEKYTISLLKQSGIDYIYQATKEVFKWIGKYKFDFYLPKHKIFLEIHGMQHYNDVKSWNTYESVKENDMQKLQLVKNNGFKLIVIDARYSKPEYIRNNFCCSDLSKYIDFEKINFNLCNKEANKSMMISICNYWENNKNTTTISEIAKIFGVHDNTVYKYLDNGGNTNICSFNKEEYKKTHISSRNAIKIKAVETNEVFDSINKANIEYKIKLKSSDIDNPNVIKAGYHWVFV